MLLILIGLPATASAASCRYAITINGKSANSLDLVAACDEGIDASEFRFLESPSARHTAVGAVEAGRHHFHIDLDGLAADISDDDYALRVGRSVVVSPEMIIPVPANGGASLDRLEFHFSAPDGAAVATGLAAGADGGYEIAANQLDDAVVIALGTFDQRSIADQAGMRMAVLDAPLKVSPDALARWMSDTAAGNTRFWHRPPVEHPLVIVVPVAGETGLPSGRTLSTGGAVVLVKLGDQTTIGQLYDEWVLVHEFIHLGSPYVRDTGAWFQEGAATYFEPILRVRAGWRTEESVWKEWLTNMPRGLPAFTETGLSHGNHSGTYWGGATFMLLADIRLRQMSNGKIGVEDCLTDILAAGGNVTAYWTTDQVLHACDRTTGTKVFSELAERHVRRGTAMDLSAVWRELGVAMDDSGAIVFTDSAPLAWVRQAIIRGGRDKSWTPLHRYPAD